MHKFISNSVNKFKHLSLTNWITEKAYQNVTSCCGIHTVSGSNAKNQSKEGTANKVINFDEIVTTRRAQAQRSILVQVQSEKSFNELQKYCSQYGTIVGAHHYTQANGEFILVEYSSQEEAQEATKNGTLKDGIETCVRTPFLWFRAAQKRSVAEDFKGSTGNLMATDGCSPIDYKAINEMMFEATSLSGQMVILFRSTTINDLGKRVRFLAARQIEESISGIFPSATACIFGSSMNGYGKLGCDLDLILRLHSLDCDLDTTKRLVFHTKQSMASSRAQVQKNLETISEMMKRFLPGVSNVRQILQARVPIIKYQHDFFDLEVDLSLNNMSGVYMSELLYAFTQIDDRVQPLVYTIRRWAQTTGVTKSSPGFWVSNFSLTCLVIFYLQQLQKPVLPTINLLMQQARPQDKRIPDEEDCLCTFLRDLNVLKFTKQNKDSLDQLLMGFFEYYSQMDFIKSAISLNDGQLHTKPNQSAVYVINPLEQTLNVTKNISPVECERFRTEVRNAAWLLESSGNVANKNETNGAWGLLNLFRDSDKPIIRPTMFFQTRILNLDKVLDSEDTSDEKVQLKKNSVKKAIIDNKKRIKTIVKDAMKSGGRKR